MFDADNTPADHAKEAEAVAALAPENQSFLPPNFAARP